MGHEMTKPLIRAGVCVAMVAVVIALTSPKQKTAAPSGNAAGAETGGEAIFTPGEYTGKGEGFGGSVQTTITVSEYAITDVQIAADTETEEIGQAAALLMVDQILEAQSPEIDGVTGASLTSDAVRKGVEKAMKEAGWDGQTIAGGAVSGGEGGGAGIYTPGEYTGKGEGFGGSVVTTITVDGNAIVDVQIEADTETAEIGQAAALILAEQILEVQGAEIDGVTGASLTSDAVRKGVEKALKEAKGE